MANEITMVSRQSDHGGEPGGERRPAQHAVLRTGRVTQMMTVPVAPVEHRQIFLSRSKQETGFLAALHTRSAWNPPHSGAVDWCILV